MRNSIIRIPILPICLKMCTLVDLSRISNNIEILINYLLLFEEIFTKVFKNALNKSISAKLLTLLIFV